MADTYTLDQAADELREMGWLDIHSQLELFEQLDTVLKTINEITTTLSPQVFKLFRIKHSH